MTDQEILDFVHDQQFHQRDELEWKIREAAVCCADDPRVTREGITLAWHPRVDWRRVVYSNRGYVETERIHVRVPRVAAYNWRSLVLVCEEIIRRQINHA